MADPPWSYKTAGGITTRGKHTHTKPTASAHYSTMSIEELCALPVGELAAENAHLYLWVTNPLLFEARPILDAWGFKYVTLLTWLKTGTLGLGYYFRGDTEHLLFAVRGKCPIEPSKRERNWFMAAKSQHSVKPAALADMVERVSPGPYVELFSRSPRMGWDSWGLGFESRTA